MIKQVKHFDWSQKMPSILGNVLSDLWSVILEYIDDREKREEEEERDEFLVKLSATRLPQM
jgi:hypothetical protein